MSGRPKRLARPGRDRDCCGAGGVTGWGWPFALSRVALFMSRVVRPDLPPNFEWWPGVASRGHTDLLTCSLSGWAVSPALRAPLASPEPECAVLRDWPRDTPSLNPFLAGPLRRPLGSKPSGLTPGPSLAVALWASGVAHGGLQREFVMGKQFQGFLPGS